MSMDARYDRSDIENVDKDMVAGVTSVLAGSLLLMVAVFDVLQGIAAIAKDDLFVVGGKDYLYELDTTTWGWVHLVLGVLAGAVAVGLLVGAAWSWAVGLVIAGLVMLTNFAFLPYYPLWSITIIAFSGLVMWALCNQLRRYDGP
jgi:hypothetical protein